MGSKLFPWEMGRWPNSSPAQSRITYSSPSLVYRLWVTATSSLGVVYTEEHKKSIHSASRDSKVPRSHCSERTNSDNRRAKLRSKKVLSEGVSDQAKPMGVRMCARTLSLTHVRAHARTHTHTYIRAHSYPHTPNTSSYKTPVISVWPKRWGSKPGSFAYPLQRPVVWHRRRDPKEAGLSWIILLHTHWKHGSAIDKC